MKIEKSILAPKLARLKTIIANKTKDLIQGVLLKDNTLIANNLDTSLIIPLETNTTECFIIPDRAIQLIGSLPEGIIEITAESNEITIKAEKIKNKFQTYDTSAFPECPKINSTNKVYIDGDELEKGLKSILYSVDANSDRPIFGGLKLECKDNKLNIVGTDGARMAWYKMECNGDFNIVVPKTSIQQLLSIGITGRLNVEINRNKALFRTDDYIFITCLLQGDYINYQAIFNRPSNSTIINRKVFLEALKRCLICMDEKNKRIVKLNLSEDKINIIVNNSKAEYKEEVKLESSIDKDITIGFNATFITECIKSYESENIELIFGGIREPLLVDSGNLLSLLLPVKIN